MHAANRNAESKCCAHVRLAAVPRGDGASLFYPRGVYMPQHRLFFAKIEIGARQPRDEIVAITRAASGFGGHVLNRERGVSIDQTFRCNICRDIQ